ncbi:MAG: hypothetical protein PHV32_04465 [Eubacteriales bacterium]|nr:hypothetical protein [Eubacteriales bacterium]
MDKYRAEWNEMLKSIGAKSMLWGIQGGNEWISYKQNDENDFSVQIFTHDNYETYKSQKNAVKSFFESRGSIFTSETDVKDIAFGYWKQLEFVDNEKYENQRKGREDSLRAITSVGSIYAPGGIVNLGTITGAPITIDNSIMEIERQIDEHGDEDKEELHAFLDEVKEMVAQYTETQALSPRPGFGARLNAHLVKHGWFYGAILQLLGTAAIQIIG